MRKTKAETVKGDVLAENQAKIDSSRGFTVPLRAAVRQRSYLFAGFLFVPSIRPDPWGV
ncbi:hypothetical protein [uncultured Ruminococcus sp.]|uniref:hypothetical protein n=1 Tax=uncultured Ruminococcus sp. TaxID=165186 RepID=UPI0025E8790C|nr:hypothetical protein [uncultured Ruminococcus sp.]